MGLQEVIEQDWGSHEWGSCPAIRLPAPPLRTQPGDASVNQDAGPHWPLPTDTSVLDSSPRPVSADGG